MTEYFYDDPIIAVFMNKRYGINYIKIDSRYELPIKLDFAIQDAIRQGGQGERSKISGITLELCGEGWYISASDPTREPEKNGYISIMPWMDTFYIHHDSVPIFDEMHEEEAEMLKDLGMWPVNKIGEWLKIRKINDYESKYYVDLSSENEESEERDGSAQKPFKTFFEAQIKTKKRTKKRKKP